MAGLPTHEADGAQGSGVITALRAGWSRWSRRVETVGHARYTRGTAPGPGAVEGRPSAVAAGDGSWERGSGEIIEEFSEKKREVVYLRPELPRRKKRRESPRRGGGRYEEKRRAWNATQIAWSGASSGGCSRCLRSAGPGVQIRATWWSWRPGFADCAPWISALAMSDSLRASPVVMRRAWLTVLGVSVSPGRCDARPNDVVFGLAPWRVSPWVTHRF